MKNSFLKKIGAFALVLSMVIGVGAHLTQASSTTFLLETIQQTSATKVVATVDPMTSGSFGPQQEIFITIAAYVSEDDYRAQINNAIVTYENSTGGFTGVTAADVLSYKGTQPVDHYPTRALNTCYQISATSGAEVSDSVDVAATLSLVTGQSGTVALKKFTNNTCTTGGQEIDHYTNANTGSLAIGLNLTQTGTGDLNGYVPAGSYFELVTTNNTGTPTFTMGVAQETY